MLAERLFDVKANVIAIRLASARTAASPPGMLAPGSERLYDLTHEYEDHRTAP